MPIQVISPNVALKLPLIDLSDFSDSEREVKAKGQITAEACKPFSLIQDPLFQATLWKLGQDEHILLLAMHHIVTDDWSMGILFREIEALYKAYSEGKSSPLPELPIQSADFAYWQRQWLQGEVLEKDLFYWKQQLSGELPVLQLPTDRPRPSVPTYRGAQRLLLLPKPLTQALKVLSKQEDTTLFMTLIAAFNTLLYRYTAQEDIIVGVESAGRNQVETEDLIGYFCNTLVLRTDLSGNPSFRELLDRVRHNVLEALTHQDIPFEKLVEELRLPRDLSRPPLFQVLFICSEFSPITTTLDLPGLSITSSWIHNGSSKADLIMFVVEDSEGLRLELDYSTDLFNANSIDRLLGNFKTLLEGIATNLEQSIAKLPLLTDQEHHQLLVEWNDTQTDYTQEQSIQQLFEAQVERNPEAVAAIFENQQLTYRELNCRANQLAHYLQKQGVGPEVLVGIYLERSLEMVEALLGILKAGGAYVPLDASYPAERLAFMLSDAQVSVLLTRQYLLEQLPNHSAQVVCLDADWEDISQESEDNPASLVTAANLAYVIYTSGSTGQPKGVAVPHQQILNRLAWMWNTYPFEPGEFNCQKTALNFVDSIWELLGPLLQGVPTVIIPDSVRQEPSKFVQTLAEHQVTRLWVVPSFLRAILDTVPNLQRRLPKLKFWVTGGEAISVELLQRFQESLPQAILYNLYGTSEVWDVTCYAPDPQHQKLARVPIGCPIANMQAYILDAHRQPVPVGVQGELYVGGVGLAREYINRPELTAEKFIPNPFDKSKGDRLYKTGDLARYLPDGNIEFLGRIDNQVKIRGFRIELGEIEALLSQHPSVAQTVVIDREDQPGNKRLVAYLVPNDPSLIQNQLRDFLKQKLPDYMIPSAFVLLETLPLTPNGKIDRRALPAPDQTRLEPEETFVAPRDELELQLTKIWETLLGIQPIGTRDNFFDLGGHSLLAVRLFAEIEKVFNKKLPLTTLFQASTVEDLSKVLRHKGYTASQSSLSEKSITRENLSFTSLVPIQPSGNKTPLFGIHVLGKGCKTYRSLANHLGVEQPIYGLNYGLAVQNSDGKLSPLLKVEELAAHYIQEMQTLQPEGPYFLAGHSFGGLIAFEMAQQLYKQGQKVALLVLFDTFHKTSVKRISWNKRAYDHLDNVFKNGFDYLLQKIIGKIKWTSNQLKRKRQSRESTLYIASRITVSAEEANTLEQHANKIASSNYVPQTYPGKVTLFKSKITSDRIAPEGWYVDPSLGWEELVGGGLEVYEISGDHHSMFREPNVQVLVDKLRICIDKALDDDREDYNPEPNDGGG